VAPGQTVVKAVTTVVTTEVPLTGATGGTTVLVGPTAEVDVLVSVQGQLVMVRVSDLVAV
jgi:hypothetical protein